MVNALGYSKKFKEKAYTANGVYSRSGNLPLIITAPHGGLLKPESIPNRIGDGSAILGDMYTKDIALGIEQFIVDHYGNGAPYVVVNNISRRKADPNRSLEEGTETEAGEQVWKAYHGRVKDAVESVLQMSLYGLLVDIHGHTHSSGMIELGYLLSPDELRSDKARLDQAILEKSSIQSLAKRHVKTKAPHRLLGLFGDSIMKSSNNQISVLPSSTIPSPHDGDYFMGGFTTQHYHNYWNGLDVVQVEIPKHLRWNKENRQHVIRAISLAIIKMLDQYYLHYSKL
ncbi:54S ribosomal protein L4 mitochondrial [Mucor velutinosus]|uniref:54S ribosomal protein L4 mitochondrial n=1 Tax=Mucor velutinosus TaxID=708070 RepID=A0AAN7HW15_9FUNG|nr:54S ribosomal protein L4 mitochondrial [Mucor velutinosus]